MAEGVKVNARLADTGWLSRVDAVRLVARATVVAPKRVTLLSAVAVAVMTGPADTMALRSEVTLAVAVTATLASRSRIGPPLATGVAKARTPMR